MLSLFRPTIYCLVILLTAGCSFLVPRLPSPQSSQEYKISFPNPHWKRIKEESSDLAFVKKRTGSIMVITSYCKKYEASSLNGLCREILHGIDDLKIGRTEETIFNSRKALRIWASGSLDGVRTYLVLQTVKKNRCVYDFVLISPSNENRGRDIVDFDQMLTTVTIN